MSDIFKHIEDRRKAVADQVEKSFNNDIEKARSGVYSDNAENRKLNRVGQKYGASGKQDDQPKGKRANVDKVGKDTSAAVMRGEVSDNEDGTSDLKAHAKNTDTEVLRKVAKSEKADPELKAAAEAELKKRGETVQDFTPIGKSKIKDASNKKAAAETLLEEWDNYTGGNGSEAGDPKILKKIIEDAGLTKEDIKKHWEKTFKEADLQEDEIDAEISNLFSEAGIEDPDADIDPEWEPTSQDRANAATGAKLRDITNTLGIFNEYVEGTADRGDVKDAIEKTGLDAEEFKKQAMVHLMERDNLSRDEVNDMIDNMYEVAEGDDDDPDDYGAPEESGSDNNSDEKADTETASNSPNKKENDAVRQWVGDDYNDDMIDSVREMIDEANITSLRVKGARSQMHQSELINNKVNEIFNSLRLGSEHKDLDDDGIKDIIWGIVRNES